MSSSPDIIKDASDALKPISDRGITVMQGWYDKDIHDRHVTLWDLGENDENFSDDDAEGVTLSVQVIVRSCQAVAQTGPVDKKIKSVMPADGIQRFQLFFVVQGTDLCRL